jgi:formylglycine-generating enzyme required for sulfatase activity
VPSNSWQVESIKAQATVPNPTTAVSDALSRLKIEWVMIPQGPFVMGSDKAKDKKAKDDECPQHKLYLPTFRIAKYPITNSQYMEYYKATGYRMPSHWKNGQIPGNK